MKSRLCRFQIDAELHVLQCNPVAQVLITLVEAPPETYLLHLFDRDAVTRVSDWITRIGSVLHPTVVPLQLMTRPNPVFGREADILPVELEFDLDGTLHLQFEGDQLLCRSKPFWMITTYLGGIFNLNALVCDASGTVLVANFARNIPSIGSDLIPLPNCFDHGTYMRILELLRKAPADDLIWNLPHVLFTPRSDKVFAGELVLFPLRIDGDLHKVLIVFREHSRPQTELPGNTISTTSFIAAIEQAMEAVAILDDQGRIIYQNHQHCEMFNCSDPREMSGRHWGDLYDQATREFVANTAYAELLRNGVWYGTVRATRRDGTTFQQLMSAKRIPGIGIIGTSIDVTEQRAMAEALRASEVELTRVETQRQLYGDIIDYASGIISIGADQIPEVLISLSTAAALDRCALYHIVDEGSLSLELVAEVAHGESCFVPQQPLPITSDDLGEIRRGGRQIYLPASEPGVLAKLRRHPEAVSFFDTVDVVGNHARYLLWCERTDAVIDERTLLVLELSTLKLGACLENYARIEAAVRRTALENIGHVAASLVHENNHLASIISSNLHILQSELGAEKTRGLVDDIQSAMKHHQELFTRLLSAARMDRYAGELIDPTEIIARSIKLMRSSLPESITLTVEHRGPPAALHADAAMFGSALFNILINAYHACGSTGVIALNTRAKGLWLDIDIRDNGCGIAPEVLRRVTDPFYSTKRRGRGTGLGLFMVKNFCTQSGGDLLIESEIGKGTCVTLRLPIAMDAELSQQAPLPLH